MKKIVRTTKVFQELNLKTGKDLTMFSCKSDTVSLVYASLKFKKESSETYCSHPFFFICLPGCTHESNLYESKREKEYLSKKKNISSS